MGKPELIQHQPEHNVPAITSDSAAIIQIIERAASNPAVDIDKMERLLKMHADIQAREAKRSYSAALAEMQEQLPVIIERGRIDIGRGKPQQYALWEDINEQIKPVLSQHGFALTFRCGQQDGKINVTGVLSHRDGHSEETTISLPIDTSGSKNAVQAVGSSTSYGKRYTASALLNLTSRGEDDDGKRAVGGFITEAQVETLQHRIVEVGADIPRFCKYMGVANLSEIPATKFEHAKAALDAKAKHS